jgi:hypothetical protein
MLRNKADDSSEYAFGRETERCMRDNRRGDYRPGRDACRERKLSVAAARRTSFNDLRDVSKAACAHARRAARHQLSDIGRVAGEREATGARWV